MGQSRALFNISVYGTSAMKKTKTLCRLMGTCSIGMNYKRTGAQSDGIKTRP